MSAPRTPAPAAQPGAASAAKPVGALRMFLRLALPMFGLGLVAAALAGSLLTGAPAGWPLRIGITGVLLFLTIFLTWERGNVLNFLNLGIYSALVFACVVVVYMIAARHPKRWDLTQDRYYSLKPQTTQFLRALTQPIRIVMFTTPDSRAEVEEFLALYKAQKPGLVSVEVHVAEQEPQIALQYDANTYPGDAYVIREGVAGAAPAAAAEAQPAPAAETPAGEGTAPRRKKVSLGTLGKDTEGKLTNAIVEVLRDQATKIYFLRGHGEKPFEKPRNLAADAPDMSYAEVRRILQERAFTVEEFSLLERGVIPEDATVIAIAGPRRDLYDLERDLLVDYVRGGGKLLVLFDAVYDPAAKFDNLIAVLREFGVDSEQNSVVMDAAAQRATGDWFTPIIQEYGNHQIVEGIQAEPFLLTSARAFRSTQPAPAGTSVIDLFKTGQSAVERAVKDALANGSRVQVPQGGFAKLSLGVAATRQVTGTTTNARLVVIGDSDVFANAYLEKTPAAVLVQSTNWLAEQKDLLAIPPRVLTETAIIVTDRQLLLLTFSLCLLVLGVLGGGLTYTVLRRKLR